MEEEDTTDRILGGVTHSTNTTNNTTDHQANNDLTDGDVVAVFGEIVEDPLLILTDNDNDPMVIRQQMQHLHRKVVRTFVRLVQDLVHRPTENKYVLCRSCRRCSIRTMIFNTHVLILFFCFLEKESRGTNYRTKFFYCYRNATSFEIINHGNVSLNCYKINEVNVYCYCSNCANKWPKPRPRYHHKRSGMGTHGRW